MADAFHEAMKAKTYQDYARSTGVVDSWMGPKEYTAFVRAVSDTAVKQLQAAGLLQQRHSPHAAKCVRPPAAMGRREDCTRFEKESP